MNIFFNIALAFNISVQYPPADDIEGEYTLIPDENDRPYRVKVEDAMKQEIPFFNVDNGVVFELYTLSNPNEPQIITLNDVHSLEQSNFNPNVPTRIIIHGWNSQGTMTPVFTDG